MMIGPIGYRQAQGQIPTHELLVYNSQYPGCCNMIHNGFS